MWVGWCLTAWAGRVLSPVGLAVSSSVDRTPLLLRLSAHQSKSCQSQATPRPMPPYHPLRKGDETKMSVHQLDFLTTYEACTNATLKGVLDGLTKDVGGLNPE